MRAGNDPHQVHVGRWLKSEPNSRLLPPPQHGADKTNAQYHHRPGGWFRDRQNWRKSAQLYLPEIEVNSAFRVGIDRNAEEAIAFRRTENAELVFAIRNIELLSARCTV